MKEARVCFLDTTLRDGEQMPGVSLVPEEKLEIAKALDDVGVDVIEAGAAITSEGERESLKLISEEGLRAEVASYARLVKRDIELAIGCGVNSIFLVAPTSDLHLKYKLRQSREQLLQQASELVDYCKDHGLIVDLCCEDGSRTELDFLLCVLKEVDGVDRFTIADTVGILLPERSKEIFAEVVKAAKVPVGVHCHDDLGLATANTLAAVEAGATYVDVTVNGFGERAGNASLEEVAVALGLVYGYKLRLKLEKLRELSELVEKIFGVPVPPNKAIVGDNAFTHEAGIHIDGILKKPETYEAIKPELVGAKRTFVLGKHVGSKAVRLMLKELGISVTDEQLLEVLERVKQMADKGKRVTSVDLEQIASLATGSERGEDLIKVEELVAVCGNRITPTASVRVKIKDSENRESAIGTGPVDAAMNAIRKATREIVPFELIEYHVDAITGGTDAAVKVLVKLRSKDRIITAQGVGTDIVMASVEALVNGINLIARRCL